jgi:hypothetical protein
MSLDFERDCWCKLSRSKTNAARAAFKPKQNGEKYGQNRQLSVAADWSAACSAHSSRTHTHAYTSGAYVSSNKCALCAFV